MARSRKRLRPPVDLPGRLAYLSPPGQADRGLGGERQERQRLLQVELDVGGGVRQVADRGFLSEPEAEVAAPGGQRDRAGDGGRPDDVAADEPPDVLEHRVAVVA